MVKAVYACPNLQDSGQLLMAQSEVCYVKFYHNTFYTFFIFQDPDDTTSELLPRFKKIGEWPNSVDQSDVPTDPSDRMGMLLFAATHFQKVFNESDGQSPNLPKGTIVRRKSVPSDQKHKMYQTQTRIHEYSNGHQVQQQSTNATPNPSEKQAVNVLV